MLHIKMSGRFAPGRLVMTHGAHDTVSPAEMEDALSRHFCCDWGDICAEDKRCNDLALKTGARLLSAYQTADKIKFWIITEADRSATTVLLPEEY